ncbi:cytochrome c [Pseudoalteromonas sp. S4741]|uniref:c-type cytochrome n=1 Tax=Pseudoalteromonas sp. S4741 TaxID=579563 RepID=UPI00110B13B0|nr:cytochrome c [Pseudoalteromonas sp. S4741]TMO28181.1 hypothetical protein CWC30_00875 [Pseudoalteromonas sp. S4741]
MNKVLKQLGVLVFFGLSVPTTMAQEIQGNAEVGAQKAAVCGACHGVNGKSAVSMYPNLAGQWPEYIESALKAYRAGERTGGVTAMMTPQAMNLSDQDIADLAAYYASKK